MTGPRSSAPCFAYATEDGATEGAASAAAEALALRVLADRLEQGEADQAPLSVSFVPAAA